MVHLVKQVLILELQLQLLHPLYFIIVLHTLVWEVKQTHLQQILFQTLLVVFNQIFHLTLQVDLVVQLLIEWQLKTQ